MSELKCTRSLALATCLRSLLSYLHISGRILRNTHGTLDPSHNAPSLHIAALARHINAHKVGRAQCALHREQPSWIEPAVARACARGGLDLELVRLVTTPEFGEGGWEVDLDGEDGTDRWGFGVGLVVGGHVACNIIGVCRERSVA